MGWYTFHSEVSKRFVANGGMLSNSARMAWNNNSYARVQWIGMARSQTSTIQNIWWVHMYIHGSQFSIVFFSSSSPYLVFFQHKWRRLHCTHIYIKTNHHTGCKARVVKHTSIWTVTFPNDFKTIAMTNKLINTPKQGTLKYTNLYGR